MPPPLPPALPPPPPPPSPPAPASKGNKTVVIVLCILLGLLVIVGGCVASCFYYVGKKAKAFSAEAQRNPQYAALSMIAAVNPDIQVVSKDPVDGKMTLKNKRTGEVVTINANDFSSENIGQAVQNFAAGQGLPSSSPESSTAAPRPISAGKAAALNATLKSFPNYVSAYPNGTTTEAGLNGFGNTHVGSYQFDTGDSAETVSNYYQKQLTDSGFTIVTQSSGSNDNGSTATFISNRASPACAFTLTAETQNGGKVHVTVNFTMAMP